MTRVVVMVGTRLMGSWIVRKVLLSGDRTRHW